MRTIFLLSCLCFAQFLAAQQDYYIRFPDDIYSSTCPTPPDDFGVPEVSYKKGTAPEMSYEDQIFTIVPEACYRIERLWRITSHPYDPNLPCIDVPNPNPYPGFSHPENLQGPVVSPPGTPAPWNTTVAKINPNDPAPTLYSKFWSATANCYQYLQTIRINDNQDPVVSSCPADLLSFEDDTPNDDQLWNELFWLNPVNDLNETPVELTVTGTDQCAGADVSISYLLFLDMDTDGVMETVVNSANPPPAGQVNYNNVFTPNFLGGQPLNFDLRPVPDNEKYRFGIQTQVDGFQRSGAVGWYTEAAPDTWELPQLPPGMHMIKWIVNDACGNEKVCEYTFVVSAENFRTLLGKAVHDTNSDCQASSAEPPGIKGWRAKLEELDANGDPGITRYSTPAIDDLYFFLADSGDYLLSVLPPNGYWESCPPDSLVTVNSAGDTTEINFAMQAAVLCPLLETDIGIWGLRRCFDNTYTVRYCNTGTVTAEDAFLRVTLDPFMNFISAGLPGTDEGNHTWRFNLGDIPAGDCGSFPLKVYLDCNNTVTGQTHCVEAHIYPDSFCLDTPGWAGAQVDVDGACLSDSVCFNIRNTGTAPTALLDYIVIEDNIINLQGSFQLLPGDSMRICVPANGSTWRLEAEQEPGSPADPMPSATVEACGQNGAGGFSTGFVSQFGEADGDPFISMDCQKSQGSFDPNDKQGYPLGLGAGHLIRPGQALEYLIRFQNTGTDTAFTVMIRDTLSPWLDPGTVTIGAASHPYRFNLSGTGILTFIFDNILLPDSSANEPASHGFIKFRVQQREGAPSGTVINNRAAIYFDFNAPVLTNETWHTVRPFFTISGIPQIQTAEGLRAIQISPNPATSDATLFLQNITYSGGQFELFDGRGQLVLKRAVSGNRIDLGKNHLIPGMYYFRLSKPGQAPGMGKVLIH